ncbi:MAG: translocation/assembly module TamB domain-containing protein [Burkholderiales bacterium]
MRRRRWRWAWIVPWFALALVAATGALYAALGSQWALDLFLLRIVAAAHGRLAIDGAEGSLLSTVRVARIAWTGDDMDVEATEASFVWSPLDLVSRRFIVRGLGAKRLAFAFKGSAGGSAGLPSSLALPLEVDVREIGVQRLEWRTASNQGAVTGVTFGYSGGATAHAIRAMRFVTVNGTLSGDADVAATAPFALSGNLAFAGDGTYGGAQTTLKVGGSLARATVDARGTFRNAGVTVKATLAPFSAAMLVTADVDARDVDVSQFAPALPATALTLTLSARPAGAGFEGDLSARNAQAGPLDTARIPVASLNSRFAWDGVALTLSNVEAEFAGGGRASGTVTVPATGTPIGFALALANIDLSRIQTSLIATRLSGTLSADVTRDRQVVRGELRQADVALAFAATVENRRVTVERLRAQEGGGTLEGSGTFDLAGPRAFSVAAKAIRFNPARFVAMPEARLDGTIDAKGTLSPQWDLVADVALAKGSKLAGLDVAGKAHAHASPKAVRDVAASVALGASTVKLDGAFGGPADTMAFDIDVPRLAELRPLLVRYAQVAVPDAFGGALRTKGKVSGAPGAPGVAMDVHGEKLVWGSALRAATLDLAASVGAGQGPAGPIALDRRPLSMKLSASGANAGGNDLAKASAAIAGTLAQHTFTVAASRDDFDFSAAGSGSLAPGKRADGAFDATWQGTIDTFANRGVYAFKLEAPATLSVSRSRVQLDGARLTVADGSAQIAKLDIDEGRVTTQGSFTGIPAAALARLAGRPLPFPSTLELGGAWSLAATPRLNGTVEIKRERGDWFATESANLDPADLALGISVLQLSAKFVDDALTASAQFRSARAGSADATVSLAAGSVPGRVATDTPLAGTLTGDLASLRPLQPWIGTFAVMDGRAHMALAVRGTLAKPDATGTLTGDGLRFDLPQYGVHLRDGTLRARLADRAIVLDEFSLGGGAGRFTAHGTLAQAAAAPGSAAGAAARVEWQATDFTVVNRPDLLLVADGKGTLAVEGRKLALAGSIGIDKGRVTYEPTSVGTLSDDVVIVGQPRAVANDGTRDLPLALDLEVALGRDFRFSGEGLETRLAGKVRITTTAGGTLNAKGTINAVAGTYFVFGQRLDIDRGRLIFDGPVNNPALDVVALRKNLAVEAGVEVTGTVRVPRVRLVSSPPVSDGEKLSWLLTGQGLDRASRGDFAMLGAASASLLGQGKRPITTQIANSIGLDDISVRETGSSVVGGTTGQVVSFGKRISDRLSLVYEQGLTVATNALRLEYALSRSLTLRAEAGTVSSFGIYFRRTYD